jgi:hypothetical protein
MKTESKEAKSDEKSAETKMFDSYLRPVSDSLGDDGSNQICGL